MTDRRSEVCHASASCPVCCTHRLLAWLTSASVCVRFSLRPTSPQLLSALDHNDAEQIRSLVASGTPIHDLTAHHSHTPLQHAIALSSPYPLHILLSAFFASSSNIHQQEKQLVLDLLITHINPTFTPSSSEHKTDDSLTPSPSHPSPNPPSSSPSPPSSSSSSDAITRVTRALAAIRRGEFVVVTDGADRENEGDLILDASFATPHNIAYMVNETSGILCVGLSAKRAQQLHLPPMVERNTESHQTAFTVTVDYNVGTTTGISAGDRAATIRALADEGVGGEAFNRPGHVFPLVAKEGGVLERPGHTEASVELSRLSGGVGVGVMCEVVRKDGEMMRPKELVEWSRRHGWECIAINDIIQYRRHTEGV